MRVFGTACSRRFKPPFDDASTTLEISLKWWGLWVCRYGEAGLKNGMGGFGGAGAGADFNNPFDLFEQFFGGGGGGFGGQRTRSRAVPGEDERFDLQLDFSEAVFGCRYAVRYFFSGSGGWGGRVGIEGG